MRQSQPVKIAYSGTGEADVHIACVSATVRSEIMTTPVVRLMQRLSYPSRFR